jgi:hypothetical protein
VLPVVTSKDIGKVNVESEDLAATREMPEMKGTEMNGRVAARSAPDDRL